MSQLLRIGSVLARTSLSRGALYEAIKRGDFPRPRRISTQRVAWLDTEVEAWIKARPVADGDAGR